MRRYPEAAAFVLAGGGSSRMGRDKGLLELGGVPLVVRTVRLVQPLVGCVRVIAPAGRYPGLELDVLPDRDFAGVERDGSRPGRLAGIATALESSPAEWNIILACDLPYLTTEWLDWLLARATVSRAQAVVPRTGRGVEPLAAAYRRGCAAP